MLLALDAILHVLGSAEISALAPSAPQEYRADIRQLINWTEYGIDICFLAYFVHRTNEKTRWPLKVLIFLKKAQCLFAVFYLVMLQFWEPNPIWTISAWLWLAFSILGLCAYSWHYRLYTRTVWADENTAKD